MSAPYASTALATSNPSSPNDVPLVMPLPTLGPIKRGGTDAMVEASQATVAADAPPVAVGYATSGSAMVEITVTTTSKATSATTQASASSLSSHKSTGLNVRLGGMIMISLFALGWVVVAF